MKKAQHTAGFEPTTSRCYNRGPTWLMLQATRDGKKTSVSGAVIVSTVVTTFVCMKSYNTRDYN